MNGITINGPDGKPIVLKSVDDVTAYAEGIKSAATQNMVKKEDYEALQQREQKRAEDARSARVTALFSELRKPVNGKALPPAAIDLIENAAKTFKSEEDTKVKFSEDGKETDLTLAEAMAKGLELVRSTGMVEFSEITTTDNNSGSSAKEKELREQYRRELKGKATFSEDEYVECNL